MSKRPVRVFFPCTGLGRQRRGFETFTIECACALRDDERLDIIVFAGGHTTEVAATTLWNLPRDSKPAMLVGRFLHRGAYFAEQLTFFIAFLPHLVIGRPDIIYFADLNLGNLCWHWRRVSHQKYRLLFYNGGLTTKPFTRADVVQQVTPMGLAEATARGEDPSRQVVLPHGVRISASLPPRATPAARMSLGFPADRKVVLSVGLLDRTIKRMDYVIREVAAMTAPPFLVMLGAESDETPGVRALAEDLLGAGNYLMRTVPREDVDGYYDAADVFVLASLREGFGLAYVEAMAHGLPLVAHDFPVTQYLLSAHGVRTNLTIVGALSHALAAVLRQPLLESDRAARHDSAFVRFGWFMLRDAYSTMLRTVAGEGREMPT